MEAAAGERGSVVVGNKLRVLCLHAEMHKLDKRYPGQVGWLFGPSGCRDTRELYYVADNDRFGCWSKGNPWCPDKYKAFLDKLCTMPRQPEWALVPDEVGDAIKTFDMWHEWKPEIEARGLVPALALQDGMTAESVKTLNPQVVFIGGTTQWKRKTMWGWCRSFQRVHVGRINTLRWLWNVARCGAESCDGTGWFRGDQKQRAGLMRFLEMQKQGLGPLQLELEFAREFGGSVPESSLCEGGGA